VNTKKINMKRSFSLKSRSSFFALSVIAGITLSLAFPPFGIPFFIIPAFMMLFAIAIRSDSGKQTAYFVYPAFVVWNLITTYWLMYATFAGGFAAILANAVLMTIPIAWIRRVLLSPMNLFLKAIFAASIWTSYEYLHFRWDLAWPWLNLGNAFGDFPKLVQFIEFTGQLGISFVIVFVSTFCFFALKDWQVIRTIGFPFRSFPADKLENKGITKDEIQTSRAYYFGLLSILLILSLSLTLYYQNKDFSSFPTAEIAVIQPNYDSYLPDSGFERMDIAQQNLLQLADSARTNKTKLILFPENAIQPLITLNHYFSQQFSDSAQAWNVTLVSGLNEYVTYPKNPPAVYRGIRNTIPFDIFNSSLIWKADGSILPYRKYNLVPIVERLPFVEFLVALDVLDWVDWSSMVGFGKGTEIVNAPFEGGSSSILICYDSVFPDWSRKYVRNGANLIGIITNDGWWGDTPGHSQHFSFGRLRAIETRRSIARSANNGISGFILPNGEVIQQSQYWTRTFLRMDVPLLSNLTFYVKYGDWIGFMSVIGWLWIVMSTSNWEKRFRKS